MFSKQLGILSYHVFTSSPVGEALDHNASEVTLNRALRNGSHKQFLLRSYEERLMLVKPGKATQLSNTSNSMTTKVVMKTP